MPKLNKATLYMRAQNLTEAGYTTLFDFMLGYCNGNEQFWKGINAGLNAIEKTQTKTVVSPEKEAQAK